MAQTGFYTGEGAGAITGGITLHGFAELEKILVGLAGNDGLDILKKSMRRAAEEMRKEVRDRAPQERGELKKSIRLRYLRAANYAVSYQIYVKRGRRPTKKEIAGGIEIGKKGLGGWFAHFLEFGTKGHMVPKNRESYITKLGGKLVTVKQFRHPGMRKHPFMRPAFDETKNQTINTFGGHTVSMIKKYFGGQSYRTMGFGYYDPMENLSAGVM